MSAELPPANSEHNSIAALSGAILLATLIFLLIPVTQRLDNDQTNVLESREMKLSKPPPPINPPDAVKPPPKKEISKPKFERHFDNLNLNQLELSLNPGISSALAVGIATGGFETEIDATEDIQKMFTFDDLSQAPDIINIPKIQFPQELIRRNVAEGRIVALIEIDERGRATVIEIISATHPQLVETAKDVIRQAQFTKPLVDGAPQKVRGKWPLILRAPK